MFNKAAHCQVLKIITKVRHVSNSKKNTLIMATKQISLLHQINMHLKKSFCFQYGLHYHSQCVFHHKWCTGRAINVLCSDNTVSNCLHMNRMCWRYNLITLHFHLYFLYMFYHNFKY